MAHVHRHAQAPPGGRCCGPGWSATAAGRPLPRSAHGPGSCRPAPGCRRRRRPISWPLASALSLGSSLDQAASTLRCSAVSAFTSACTRSRSSPLTALASTAGKSSFSSSAWCSYTASRKNLKVSVAICRARAAGSSSAGKRAQRLQMRQDAGMALREIVDRRMTGRVGGVAVHVEPSRTRGHMPWADVAGHRRTAFAARFCARSIARRDAAHAFTPSPPAPHAPRRAPARSARPSAR